MLNIPIDTTPPQKERKARPLMYVRVDQRERFKAVANFHGLSMVELMDRVLTALEADADGRKPQEQQP